MPTYQLDALGALGDPTRRAIFELLARRPSSVQELADQLPISRPAVSQHLKVLREAGFASVRADGNRRLYAIDSRPLQAVDSWLDQFRRFWQHKLDALDTEIARGKRARRRAKGRNPPRTTRRPSV